MDPVETVKALADGAGQSNGAIFVLSVGVVALVVALVWVSRALLAAKDGQLTEYKADRKEANEQIAKLAIYIDNNTQVLLEVSKSLTENSLETKLLRESRQNAKPGI